MKKLGSLFLSILLMIILVIFGLRMILSQVLLNEGFYKELQQEVNLSGAILENVILDLKTLMRTNHLPEELVEDLVPLTDIEAAIELQTYETIELLKGNHNTMTVFDPEPYIWELEPRIMNYLNQEGYKVEESGYEDLAAINKGVYDLTRGDIHLFDISKLMYSGTVKTISTTIQFIIGPYPLVLSMAIMGIYLFIWKRDWRQILYWISTPVLASGIFGITMLSQMPEKMVGISTNQAFNQAIKEVILQFINDGHRISLTLLILGVSVFLSLILEKFIKKQTYSY